MAHTTSIPAALRETAGRVSSRIRQHIPTLTAVPLPSRLEQRLLRKSWPTRELARPPADSGLLPVLGDAGAPVVGHTLDLMRFGPLVARRRYAEYGPVYWTSAFGIRIVTLTGPEATQIALVNKDKAFSQEGWRYFIERFFTRGLMLLDFGEHHAHRRIMQQAFTRDRLAGYVSEMVPVFRDGVAKWAGTPRLRLYWALKQLTLDAAIRVFMDMPTGPDAQRINRAFVAAVRAGTAIVRAPVPGGRWAAGLAGRRALEKYFSAALPAKRAAGGHDLFSVLCQCRTNDGASFDDQDIVDHMIFLMMAAHDTTTITSTAACYFLGAHPEWQERARAESLALGDRPLDLQALESLTTLDLVIKESLRMVSPVPSLGRMTVRDTEVLGRFIPARTLVAVSPAVNHFSADHWTNPDSFDPERFNETRREDKSHRYAWVPFGGGAHKCIGLQFGTLEVKALLHEMVRNYRWSLPKNYRIRWDHLSLPVPVDGLPVTLTPLVVT